MLWAMKWCAGRLWVVIAGGLLLASNASAADANSVESHTFRPEKREFRAEFAKRLKVPAGFSVSVFATGLQNARMMLRGPGGEIYLSRYNQGDVLMLRDSGGRAEPPKTIAKIEKVHGLAIADGTIYLASDTKLLKARLKRDGTIEEPIQFATLPDGGQHPRRTLGFGPDGMLYVSIGSTCNACEESNPEHAAMLRLRPDGSQRTIFARGLRNTIGFDWHPETKALWGFDHGSDERGNDLPPEELNLLEEGGDYGWPFCFGDQKVDRKMKPPAQGPGKDERCAESVGAVLTYQAHAAPIAFVFYDGQQFPAEFRGDGFVAFHGSWNRKPAVGYSVGRVRFEAGKPVKIEVFATGFLMEGGQAHFGRPAGLAVARDGSLLVSDDANGTIYRISHPSGSR